MQKSRRRYEAAVRGSLTVEAAWVVPVTFIVLAVLISLTFYIHNHIWYRCGALEAAVIGNLNAGPEDTGEDAVRRAAEQRIRDQVMPGTPPQLTVRGNKRQAEVIYAGSASGTGVEEPAPYRVRERVTYVNPETAVRLRRMLKQFSG